MEVIVDTNIWLSAHFWGGSVGQILNLLFEKRVFEPVFSIDTFEELCKKLEIFYSKQGEVFNSFSFSKNLRILAKFYTTESQDSIVVRDPKDQMFVDLALSSQADFLVTGDKDLLVLKKIGKTIVTTPRDFIQLDK